MSRIIAGALGGFRLTGVSGERTRPTTDRVKEALFSRLESYGALDQSRILDLFGGSGALGCEALSRGAVHADFVETYPKAQVAIEKNLGAVLRNLSAPQQAAGLLHRKSARAFLTGYRGEPWNLVFIDPPYALENAELQQLLVLLTAHLATGAVVVVERSSRTPEPSWPAGIEKFSHKKYGETVLYYAEPGTA